MTKKKLKKIIDGNIFSLTIQILIVLSLVTFSIDTLPDLSIVSKKILSGIEIFTVIFFTIEYIARIIIADKKRILFLVSMELST